MPRPVRHRLHAGVSNVHLSVDDSYATEYENLARPPRIGNDALCGCPNAWCGMGGGIRSIDADTYPEFLEHVYPKEQWDAFIEGLNDELRSTSIPPCPSSLLLAVPLLGWGCFYMLRDRSALEREDGVARRIEEENDRLALQGLKWTDVTWISGASSSSFYSSSSSTDSTSHSSSSSTTLLCCIRRIPNIRGSLTLQLDVAARTRFELDHPQAEQFLAKRLFQRAHSMGLGTGTGPSQHASRTNTFHTHRAIPGSPSFTRATTRTTQTTPGATTAATAAGGGGGSGGGTLTAAPSMHLDPGLAVDSLTSPSASPATTSAAVTTAATAATFVPVTTDGGDENPASTIKPPWFASTRVAPAPLPPPKLPPLANTCTPNTIHTHTANISQPPHRSPRPPVAWGSHTEADTGGGGGVEAAAATGSSAGGGTGTQTGTPRDPSLVAAQMKLLQRQATRVATLRRASLLLAAHDDEDDEDEDDEGTLGQHATPLRIRGAWVDHPPTTTTSEEGGAADAPVGVTPINIAAAGASSGGGTHGHPLPSRSHTMLMRLSGRSRRGTARGGGLHSQTHTPRRGAAVAGPLPLMDGANETAEAFRAAAEAAAAARRSASSSPHPVQPIPPGSSSSPSPPAFVPITSSIFVPITSSIPANSAVRPTVIATDTGTGTGGGGSGRRGGTRISPRKRYEAPPSIHDTSPSSSNSTSSPNRHGVGVADLAQVSPVTPNPSKWRHSGLTTSSASKGGRTTSSASRRTIGHGHETHLAIHTHTHNNSNGNHPSSSSNLDPDAYVEWTHRSGNTETDAGGSLFGGGTSTLGTVGDKGPASASSSVSVSPSPTPIGPPHGRTRPPPSQQAMV